MRRRCLCNSLYLLATVILKIAYSLYSANSIDTRLTSLMENTYFSPVVTVQPSIREILPDILDSVRLSSRSRVAANSCIVIRYHKHERECYHNWVTFVYIAYEVAFGEKSWVVFNPEVAHGIELAKEEVDKVIEDEITQKLTTDLLQSIERKFQVDLERSVDMVLVKIKLILQNGTHHIQDKLIEIQDILDVMRKNKENVVEECLLQKGNETSLLAEKALHQMVVCGYALIGQDPALAVNTVIKLKNMIRQAVKPIYEQKQEIYGLLKVCGHNHDALRKVVQCVISKSPLIKTVMMDITGKLIEGVVELTKLMAHGAMHEACLIEVVKTVEDEAIELIRDVKLCVYGNNTYEEDMNKFIAENNATVLERKNRDVKYNTGKNTSKEDEMQVLLRRMLNDDKAIDIDKSLKDKLMKLQIDVNSISNDAKSIVDKDK